MKASGKSHPLSEPGSEPGFVDLVSGNSEHGLLSLIDGGWVGRPGDSVEIEEHHQGRPGRTLVAIEERVVPPQPAGEDGGLAEQVGVELLATEAGARGVQGRVSQVDT